jgi:tetratricopeptide (TPR) repeat protein
VQKKTEYEEAIDLYFGETPTGKQKAQEILLQTLQKSGDKILKSKAAYFLGSIHLTFLLQESLKKSPNSKQTVLLMQGLEWLKKSHEWGNEQATLLLGKIYCVDGKEQLDQLEIFVEEKLLGKIPIYDENLLDSIYATQYLLALSKNKEAGLVLRRFALRYLVLLDELVLGNGKRLQGNSFTKCQATRPMFTDPVDLQFHQQVSNLANVSKVAITRTDNGEETPVTLAISAESFADKGAYHAMEQMYRLHSAKSIVLPEYKGPLPDPKKAMPLAKKMWERNLAAFKKATEWLENTKDLPCQDEPSVWNMEFYRLNLVYIEARISGKTHEQASTVRNAAVDQKRAELKRKQADSLKLQFFSSSNPAALYQEGLRLIGEQQFQQAAKVLQQALAGFKTIQAFATIRNSSSDSLDCGNCYLALAQCFRATKRYEDALLECDAAVDVFKEHGEFDKIQKTMEIFRSCLNESKPTLMYLMEQPTELFAARKFYQAKEVLEYLLRATRDTKMWVKPLSEIAKIIAFEKSKYAVTKQYQELTGQEEKLQQESSDLERKITELEVQHKLVETELPKLQTDLNEIRIKINKSPADTQNGELFKQEGLLLAAINVGQEKSLGFQRQTTENYIRLNTVLRAIAGIQPQLNQVLQQQSNVLQEDMRLLTGLMQSIAWFATAAPSKRQ